jgi:hypothetical protein
MGEPDLQAGLKGLKHSLQRIKAFLVWEQLKQTETRPETAPSFRIQDDTEEDLRNEYSHFLSLSVQIHSILNDASRAMGDTERQTVQRQLARIERQMYGLNLGQRFWRS